MAWTYSGNPADSAKDEIRFLIQDTDQANPLVSDEEIAYAIAHETTTLAAAAFCLEALAAKFAARADTTLTSGSDTVRKSYSKMAEGFASLAVTLRARVTLTSSTGAPWHGGGSLARKDALAAAPDRVQPTFVRGQFSQPRGR
jgi:hypothetical protein